MLSILGLLGLTNVCRVSGWALATSFCPANFGARAIVLDVMKYLTMIEESNKMMRVR